jgi:hypothetical protein
MKDSDKAVAGGAAAVVLGHKAPKNILGYEKVHHGTSTEAAASIRKTGLQKSKSGTGVSANDAAIGRAKIEELKGKVYTAKIKATADAHQPGFLGHKMGDTVTARVPYRAPHRLAKDKVFSDLVDQAKGAEKTSGKHQLKNLRIYKHSIHQRFIEGPEYKGTKQFATKGNIRRYLGQAGGKARFAKGVAQAVGAGASGLYAAAHALKAAKEKV